jgi:hypothetical protein
MERDAQELYVLTVGFSFAMLASRRSNTRPLRTALCVVEYPPLRRTRQCPSSPIAFGRRTSPSGR